MDDYLEEAQKDRECEFLTVETSAKQLRVPGSSFRAPPSLPPGCCPAGNASFWWHFYPDDSEEYTRGLKSLYNPGIRLAVSQRAEKLVQSRDSPCREPVDDYLEEAQKDRECEFLSSGFRAGLEV